MISVSDTDSADGRFYYLQNQNGRFFTHGRNRKRVGEEVKKIYNK